MLEILTAAQAAERTKVARATIDAACKSGALVAADAHPESTKRAWRILAEDVRDWIRAGMPTKPASA